MLKLNSTLLFITVILWFANNSSQKIFPYVTLNNHSAVALANLKEASQNRFNFLKENEYLRISWNVECMQHCSFCYLNCTELTDLPNNCSGLKRKENFALLKIMPNQMFQFTLICFNQHLNAWKVVYEKILNFEYPQMIENFRTVDASTADNHESKVTLSWKSIKDAESLYYVPILTYYEKQKSPSSSENIKVYDTNSVSLSMMKPATEYVFSLTNTSKLLGWKSDPVYLNLTTPPVISSMLEVGKITTTSLKLKFTPTDVDGARFEKYEFVFNVNDKVNITLTKDPNDESRSFLFKNLKPGRKYKCYLFTVYNSVRSSPVVKVFITYPEKVENFHVIARSKSVKLFWTAHDPTLPYIYYRISYSGTDGLKSSESFDTSQCQFLASHLQPSTWYTFSVTTIADDLESESASVTVLTGPTGMHLQAFPLQVHRIENTMAEVSFSKYFFSDSNGVVNNYNIIVTEDSELDKFEYHLYNWEMVKEFDTSPPYSTTPPDYQPFVNPKTKDASYVIGLDTCDGKHKFCNGPLKPDATYFVKLRACTVANICMESDYVKVSPETIVHSSYSENHAEILILLSSAVFLHLSASLDSLFY
ncbi:Tyrosine-protein phosphatase 10D [Trichinella pseudospiralis]|uniref:protein-tyrosine-phosphatase n=1 Tax=Trichinella pseudospiralis TaxID=6337 RepID=A0A0V1E017_TRIPS|nr:Tyrosine-protein phosphatase 10D [Trichinella pseudospiralis]